MLRLTEAMLGFAVLQVEHALQRAVDVEKKRRPARADAGLSWATLIAHDPAPRATPSWPPVKMLPAAMPPTCVPWSQSVECVHSSPLPGRTVERSRRPGSEASVTKQACETIRPVNALCWLSTPESMIATW